MQGVDCLFLFYWWGHNERGVKSLLCYFKSHVWAVCKLRAGLYRVPGDLQGCHRRSRFTQDTLISGCSPGHVHPLPPPPCKKIASRVGQIVVDKGVLCTKSVFFFPSMVLPKYFKSFNSCLHHNSLEKPHSQERLLCSDFSTDIFLFPSLKMGVLCTLCF